VALLISFKSTPYSVTAPGQVRRRGRQTSGILTDSSSLLPVVVFERLLGPGATAIRSPNKLGSSTASGTIILFPSSC